MAPSVEGREATDFREDYWSFKADTVGRLSALEKAAAVEMVHRKNVEERLKSIEGTLKTLNWLLIGGFVSALVAFAMKGGFSIP